MRMRRRKKGISKGTIAILVALIAIPLFFYSQYQKDINTPVDETSDTTVHFRIDRGESAKTIGKKLEEEGLIRNARSFYIYIKRNEPEINILAGRFPLSPKMTVPEIIKTITSPSKAEFVITILEGHMIRDIDKRLVKMDLISPGDFKTAVRNFDDWDRYDFLDREKLSRLDLPLEGYIFPDTYFLNPNDFHSNELIHKALNNFERRFAGVRNQISERSIHEIITMASIIEIEVFGREDRKLVSGILWKRLENGWRLDADATLLYIKNDRTITAADLQSDSPYNTRKLRGLPPGPVSNPGLESIEAAINPTPSNYWFYLNRQDTGETIFAETNDEHNRNRARYL